MTKAGSPFSPAPFGMAAFGISTVLLCYWNIGVQPLSALNISLAVWFGCMAQYICGFISCYQGGMVDTMIYLCFGSFWIIFVVIEMLPYVSDDGGFVAEPPLAYKGWYCVVWTYLTIVFAFCAATISWLSVVSLSLMSMLWLGLAVFNFTLSEPWLKAAGWCGIGGGAIGVYIALGVHVNITFGKEILPMLGTRFAPDMSKFQDEPAEAESREKDLEQDEELSSSKTSSLEEE